MSNYEFCRTQGAEICTLTQAEKYLFWRYPRCLKGQKKYLFWQYPRCFMGYCLSQGADFGNTEVAPWDLGKNIFFCRYQARRKFACGLRNHIITIIFYHDFSRNGFRQKNADLLARGAPNPSPPQIRRITIFHLMFYRSTQPKRNKSELRSNWWSIVLTGTSTSRRVNGWRG